MGKFHSYVGEGIIVSNFYLLFLLFFQNIHEMPSLIFLEKKIQTAAVVFVSFNFWISCHCPQPFSHIVTVSGHDSDSMLTSRVLPH